MGGAVWAKAGPPQQVQNGANPEAYWQQAKSLIRQGAYRQALESLDHLSTLVPDDPWVPLYRELCQARLASPESFRPLSPSELASLTARLEQEAQAQRRTAAIHQTMERQLRDEQTQWDRTLARLKKEAESVAEAQRRQERAEAATRARAEGLARAVKPPQPPSIREPHRAVSPLGPPPSPPVETKTLTMIPLWKVGPDVGQAGMPIGGGPSPPEALPGELVPAREGVVSPSLVGRPAPPPGGMEIHARQMHVEPDRHLAVAQGDVELAYENAFLTCDQLTVLTDTHDVYAEGHVRLEDGVQLFRGEMIHYNLRTKKGRFLQGTVSSPIWHLHGRSIEHLAEGVYQVTPGYLTSCNLEPAHFTFSGRRAIVLAHDEIARLRHPTLVVEQLPVIYLPALSVANRQSPFFIIPGKKKPWEEFALMGYRYEWPEGHDGTLRLDWRRAFGWATGIDHRFQTKTLGKGLLKAYYNEERYIRRPESEEPPKGANINRYRLLWRHQYKPLPDTSVVTDIQEFSDVDFRKDLLFHDEFKRDDVGTTGSISWVTSTSDYSFSALLNKRTNRFDTVDEQLPQLTWETSSRPIGDSPVFSESKVGVTNFETKRAHADNDTDVVRVDWFQQFKYAMNLFRPIEVTPRVGVRQAYYTKDKQGGSERPQGKRDLLSGQFSMGADASLKLFRTFPFSTNAWGLDLNWLRHVITPTLAYSYVHRPTAPNDLLTFPAAGGSTNSLTFGLENKLQTKRSRVPLGGQGQVKQPAGRLESLDFARLTASVPYTFRGNHNKQGGRLNDWSFDVELLPWPWLRVESNWSYPSHFLKGSRDRRLTTWNLDVIMAGGRARGGQDTQASAANAPDLRTTSLPEGVERYQPGPRGGTELLMPLGLWYLGFGHRYSSDDKTEAVVQFDRRLSEKWQIGTFHRFTWKEVAGGSKRFYNARERQYILRRDLHDWLAEVVYRVDREFGEELFFTLTLKAYPGLPIEMGESYHQPKMGSQSSPFSPVGK